MAKQKETAVVFSQEKLTDGIYSMWIETPAIAAAAKAGQFLSLYCGTADRLLPRPISICGIDRENGRIRIVYRVAGKGTEEFSSYQKGDPVTILGPLGNGFPLPEGKVMLIGGGIGIPPMLQLAKELPGEKLAVLGYRTGKTAKDEFLLDEFRQVLPTWVATEDGSDGTKGNVLDAIKGEKLAADVICACGPTPMLRAIKAYAASQGIRCFISMEERMACGIGACLGCVCGSKDTDSHSNVHNKRICKDGPVFDAEEVEL